MYLKYAHPGCSWWAKVAATGLSLLALGGICLRPRRHLQRGQQEATTELSAHVSLHCGERQRPPPGGQCVVKILHISDTHARHREMAQKFAMPPADLLLHTGDVTNLGTDPEFEDFDMWLDDLKHRYKHGIYVVTGNHDWMWALNSVLEKKLAPQELLNANFVQKKLSNARVLHHKLVEVAGLRIYGSDWCPWFEFTAPGDTWPADTARSRVYNHWKQELKGALAAPAHRYEEIPAGVDILMSHMAPRDIFDHIMEGTWGSSQALTQRIWAVKPKAHLFGHIHEGRGEWERCNASEAYQGGAEYAPVPGKVFAARPPPAASYPTDLILNNAQMNAQWVDEAYGGPNAAAIVAPGKLITAEWKQNRWQFTARPVAMAD